MVNISRKLSVLTAICILTAAGAANLFAEGDLSMELNVNNVILQTRDAGGDSYWGWMTAGSAGFSFKSQDNKNVKADLAFSFTFPETDFGLYFGAPEGTLVMPAISLDRAWVKARFPEFRITAGKTRLDWGDGFVFNSGDLIFGSTGTSVDLTAAEIRTDTRWLSALNVPLGRFSFLEAVVIPPEADLENGLSVGRIFDTSAGGRFYTKLDGIKVEGGYFFDNSKSATDLHKAYLGFQGNLYADWYIASSVSLPVSGSLKQTAKDSFNISGGLFYLININSISSLSLRLETLYRPFKSWEETVPVSADESPEYALLLYPEIGWNLTDTIGLSVRSIFSPVDLSSIISAGASWNVLEGFDLGLHLTVSAGDPDDIFSWKKAPDLWVPGVDIIDGAAMIISINYIY